MARRREAGFTLVELMVSVVLAAIATGFAFSIYARASQASRAQARVAEAQQSLRAATQLMSRELRQAGYLASIVNASGGPLAGSSFIAYDNETGDGTDSFRVVYADLSVYSKVDSPTPPFNAAVSEVDNIDGWADGDVAIAVKVGGSARGQGCIMKITQLVPGGPKLQHNPGAGGSPWNQPGNTQCANLAGTWADGYTIFTKFIARKYRIKPSDARGVLQMSPSGGFVVGDWQDIALGVIDMQLAVYVYTDPDGAGPAAGSYNWYSAGNMTTALTPPPGAVAQPLKVRLSLLAKAIAPAGASTLDKTPDFFNASMPLANNDLGNRAGTTLPVTTTTSPYHGDNLYRWTTVMIDLRNMGVGL